MKLSVSLPDKEVEFLDRYAANHGGSRSAVVLRAVRLLREDDLADQYEEAWTEWEESGEARVWDAIVGEGLEDDPHDWSAETGDEKASGRRAAG